MSQRRLQAGNEAHDFKKGGSSALGPFEILEPFLRLPRRSRYAWVSAVAGPKPVASDRNSI
jgi:hypothetical protein